MGLELWTVYNRRLFLGCVAVVEVLGLLAIAGIVFWLVKYQGGFSSDTPGIPFNWHPVLMTTSLVFLYAQGALLYRLVPRDETVRLRLKMGHAGTMVLAFILMVVGLQAVFDDHNLSTPPKPNLYTLHSWIGLLAALLFACQWALGFTAFMVNQRIRLHIHAILLNFHRFFGSVILCLAVCAACLGILDKMLLYNPAGYKAKGPEGILLNITGLLFILFAVGVVFLLNKFSKDEVQASGWQKNKTIHITSTDTDM